MKIIAKASMKTRSEIPRADLHSPEELLEGAETLFEQHSPHMIRAAVLEAITALERYVHATVFSSLKGKLDPLLVEWLEEKTRLDFDSRLSVLAPVAIEQAVDKKERLWQQYKRAREIRNRVVHSGIKVSETEARFVIDTVYDWLAYLGSTLELELSLLRLKEYVEQKQIPVDTYVSALALIEGYFSGSYRAKVKNNHGDENFVIKIGPFNTSVDVVLTDGVPFVTVPSQWAPNLLEEELFQGALSELAPGLHQKVLIVFRRGDLDDEYHKNVFKVPVQRKRARGFKVMYVIIIKLPEEPAV